ncbi:MAG: PRC-barrel domain-containing protein [Actinomycetota bacterium]
MADQRQPISWMALEKGTPVVAAGGEEVGKVREVIADEQSEIFSGVTIDTGLLSEPRFVPAEVIEEMTDDVVKLIITAEHADKLEPYEC